MDFSFFSMKDDFIPENPSDSAPSLNGMEWEFNVYDVKRCWWWWWRRCCCWWWYSSSPFGIHSTTHFNGTRWRKEEISIKRRENWVNDYDFVTDHHLIFSWLLMMMMTLPLFFWLKWVRPLFSVHYFAGKITLFLMSEIMVSMEMMMMSDDAWKPGSHDPLPSSSLPFDSWFILF